MTSELIHAREYRRYQFLNDMLVSEALEKVKKSVPKWDVKYIETTPKGMIFRLESPIME